MINNTIDDVTFYISDKSNRIVLGCILLGLGVSLIVSGYIPMPAYKKEVYI